MRNTRRWSPSKRGEFLREWLLLFGMLIEESGGFPQYPYLGGQGRLRDSVNVLLTPFDRWCMYSPLLGIKLLCHFKQVTVWSEVWCTFTQGWWLSGNRCDPYWVVRNNCKTIFLKKSWYCLFYMFTVSGFEAGVTWLGNICTLGKCRYCCCATGTIGYPIAEGPWPGNV